MKCSAWMSRLKFATSQKLPDVRVNASYQANGLGGTQVLRTGGFPGTIVGPGSVTTFGTAVDITLAELRLEAFLPADDETAAILEHSASDAT